MLRLLCVVLTNGSLPTDCARFRRLLLLSTNQGAPAMRTPGNIPTPDKLRKLAQALGKAYLRGHSRISPLRCPAVHKCTGSRQVSSGRAHARLISTFTCGFRVSDGYFEPPGAIATAQVRPYGVMGMSECASCTQLFSLYWKVNALVIAPRPRSYVGSIGLRGLQMRSCPPCHYTLSHTCSRFCCHRLGASPIRLGMPHRVGCDTAGG